MDMAMSALDVEKRHLLAEIVDALRHGDSIARLQAKLLVLREQYRALCQQTRDVL